MIDLTAFSDYQSFLKKLNATKKLHYFIDDQEFKTPIDIDVLKELGFIHIIPIDRYQNYQSNGHHWTTSFVWNTIIPRLAKDLDIPFISEDFNFIPMHSSCHDLSFHNPKADHILTIGRCRNELTNSAFSNIVRCFAADGKRVCDCWTDYHGLFRYYHSCCIIKNKTSTSTRVLLINCDSMSIPIVPILIPYFKGIYVLDNRTHKPWFKENVDISEVTDYIALSLTRSYVYSDTFVYRDTSNNKIFKQNLQ